MENTNQQCIICYNDNREIVYNINCKCSYNICKICYDKLTYKNVNFKCLYGCKNKISKNISTDIRLELFFSIIESISEPILKLILNSNNTSPLWIIAYLIVSLFITFCIMYPLAIISSVIFIRSDIGSMLFRYLTFPSAIVILFLFMIR